jgi:hypothetical protein
MLYASATKWCDIGGMELDMKHMLIGAVMLGGAGGYVWSAVFPPAPTAQFEPAVRISKNRTSPALIEVPPTRADAEADSVWASGRSTAAPAETTASEEPSPKALRTVEQSMTYSGCNEVRALSKAPLFAGQPGYRSDMDGDADGVACEPIR